MPNETLIEQAYTLIQINHVDEARPVLAELFRANQNDSEVWALMAEIAPTEGTREEALRKVADLSADNRLTEWANTELSRLKGIDTGAAKTVPPLPSVPESWDAGPLFEPLPQPESGSSHREAPQPGKFLESLFARNEKQADSVAYTIRSIGGWIIMLGVIIFIGAIISEPFNNLLSGIGIRMGLVAIALALIGGLVVGIGYTVGD